MAPKRKCFLGSIVILLWVVSFSHCKTIDQLIREAGQTDQQATDPGERTSQNSPIQSDNVVVEYDIELSREEYNKAKEATKRRKRRKAVKEPSKLWPDGFIKFSIDSSFTKKERDTTIAAIAEWDKYTCLTFRHVSSDRSDLELGVTGADGCSSAVGYQNKKNKQTINLSSGCRKKHLILHEIGHAIGFWHEHSRTDRDKYIRIIWNNVPDDFYFVRQFSVSDSINMGVPYDYKSIMHYGQYYFSRNGQRTIETIDTRMQDVIGTANGLSFNDIKLANLMYSCGDHCRNQPKCPSVGFLDEGCECLCPGKPTKRCFDGCNPWTNWGSCSKTCGHGSKKRSRNCPSFGRHIETETCQITCDVWGPWRHWGRCSVTCGLGQRQRQRECRGTGCVGKNIQREACQEPECIAQWERWSDWNACSRTCRGGWKERNRACAPPEGNCVGDSRQSRRCNEAIPCRIVGVWDNWGSWSLCKNGRQQMTRKCNPRNCEGSGTQTRTCKEKPVGVWDNWASWSSCSGGRQERTRKCKPRDCEGSGSESRTCKERCNWGLWRQWNSCSVTCGRGTRKRRRFITADSDSSCRPTSETQQKTCQACKEIWQPWSACSASCNSGRKQRNRVCNAANCQGRRSEIISCNTGRCPPPPIVCDWSTWGLWEPCACRNGRGIRGRTRYLKQDSSTSCSSPRDTESESCNSVQCIDEWGPWRHWGRCSVTCDRGQRKRQRECKGTRCFGQNIQTEACQEPGCNEWGPWKHWGRCSVTCGLGRRQRQRECKGTRCFGQDIQTEECQESQCSKWNAWNNWNACSRTCGRGIQGRLRDCSPPRGNCEGSGSETRSCDNKECPPPRPLVDAWGPWRHWEHCSVTCDRGQRQRQRECKGTRCFGQNIQREACQEPDCRCEWENWLAWGLCTRKCGQVPGMQKRFRLLTRDSPSSCPTTRLTETRICNTNRCEGCDWKEWGQWSSCSCKSTGESQRRIRYPTSGSRCSVQIQTETQGCNTCIGIWLKWGAWSSCVGGRQERTRQCSPAGGKCEGPSMAIRRCEPVSNTLLSCDFERHCSISVSKINSIFDWKKQKGKTPSDSTGPTTDHTFNNISGHFMYTEASNIPGSAYARMQTEPPLTHRSDQVCVRFWYNMRGENMGTLYVFYIEHGQTDKKVWTKHGHQGAEWKQALLAIRTTPNTKFKIQFEAIKGKDHQSDICVDDLYIYSCGRN